MRQARFMGVIPIVVLGAMLLAACGGDGAGKGGTASKRVADTQPSIAITTPREGGKVGPDFDVVVRVRHFTLDSAALGKRNERGHGHVLFSLDAGRFDTVKHSSTGALSASLGTTGETSVNASPGIGYTRIPPGTYTLTAQLAGNDGTPIDGARTSIRVTVVTAAAATDLRQRAERPGIVFPADGETVGPNFTATAVMPKGFAVVPSLYGGENRKGAGHLLWRIDDGRYDTIRYSSGGRMAEQIGVSGSYSPGTSMSMSYRGIPTGRHTLKLVLANNDHTRTSRRYTVHFTIS